MAFTDPQKAQIRKYLGYSGLWPNVDTVLEQAMDAIGNDADAVAVTLTYLTNCATVDAQLLLQLSFNYVSQGSGSAKLDMAQGAVLARAEGRRWCGALAAMMGVDARHSYFDPTLSNDAPKLGLSSFVGVQGTGNAMRFG